MRYEWVVYITLALIGALVIVLEIRCIPESQHLDGAPSTVRLFTDPFDYCSFVNTWDDPKGDFRWKGPDLPAVITDKLAAVLEAPGGGSALIPTTVWRCDGGKVLACTVGANLNCGQANTNSEPTSAMVQWCADPSHTDMPASVSGHDTIYAWTCQDGAPVIVRQFWTQDERGFVKELWYEITP